MSSPLNRRQMLKTLGAMAVSPGIVKSFSGMQGPSRETGVLQEGQRQALEKPLTAVVLGAGNRGNVYAGYSLLHPEELKMVGVAEPVPYKNETFAKKYGIFDKHRFVTWEHALDVPKFADVVFITTPDNLHYGPAMRALELGYDLLLEKVIAQTWKECRDILDQARRYGRIVAVCHVLRYSPYFLKLKEVCDTGEIGEIVSIQHLEPVEHIHMAHSFVRGNWRNSRESNPMILAKSCHDLDILRWVVGKPCTRIQSFGSLTLFRPEMAPAGSPARCTDGCPAEAECPFSALKIYLRRRTWLGHLNLLEQTDEAILRALREGPYGRCVYRCDNDVVDHQICSIEFAGGVTSSFSMEGLTSYGGRKTRVMGTRGDVVGDETILTVFSFKTGQPYTWNAREAAKVNAGHGGGDYGLVRDFIQAVSRRDPSLLSSTLEASVESHLMGFKAEESRLTGKALEVNLESS